MNASNIELPETDDEEEEFVVPRKSTRANLIVDESSDDDEEEILRKSIYKVESDEEEPIEEQAYSKATRRSINGFAPRKSQMVAPENDSDSDDSSADIIEEVSEEEREGDKNEKAASASRSLFSSTMIRSPFKDISNESFDKSIKIKMSSTVSPKEDFSFDEAAGLLDEAAGGVEKIMVSPAQYDQAVAELGNIEQQRNTMMKLISSCTLPDGGEKLKTRLKALRAEIDEKKQLIAMMEVDKSKSVKNEIVKSFNSEQTSVHAITINDSVEFQKVTDLQDVIPVGNIGVKKFNEQKSLAIGKLTEICDDIGKRPSEDVLAEPPKHLKITLMKHQLHALEFMMWREKVKPRGGILADDMGLGKTLTAISLILKGIQQEENDEDESDSDDDKDDEGWKVRGRKDMRIGGTLVISPASLLKQWECEIKSKVKRGAIDLNVFHGPNREYKAGRLAKNDVVLTTYQVAVSEEKNNGILYQIKWKRIILDEGHVIRNHKSKQSEAMCKLFGKYRWVMTGTPIHNKEFDIYATIKFLKCPPFSDLLYWKRYIEVNKGKESSPRVQVLLQAILLRRTKDQLVLSGEMDSLPTKTVTQFDVTMSTEERKIYSKFMAYSQTIFANFLQQHNDRNDNYTYDQNRLGKLYKKLCKKFNVERQIKAHEILTLLLRLRQICCHPGLTKGSRDQFDGEDIDGDNQEAHDADESVGLMQEFDNLNIHGDDDDDDDGVIADDVYNLDIPSSKLSKMMEVFREHLLGTPDKVIIVSQWTSYLSIIRGMLEIEGVSYCELNGKVPVKFRNDIVVDFNDPKSNKKVMLLSLAAGGVGLNLVGANYLFFMDLHWNPQLEQQAQDRIYRYGQKKDVKIFK